MFKVRGSHSRCFCVVDYCKIPRFSKETQVFSRPVWWPWIFRPVVRRKVEGTGCEFNHLWKGQLRLLVCAILDATRAIFSRILAHYFLDKARYGLPFAVVAMGSSRGDTAFSGVPIWNRETTTWVCLKCPAPPCPIFPFTCCLLIWFMLTSCYVFREFFFEVFCSKFQVSGSGCPV